MTPVEAGAWNVWTMQIVISGHWSQSIGADVSGQQGMSADISAATISMAAIGAALAALAGAENGANTSPAIKRIASSRPRWIEMFTLIFSHDPARMETSAGSLIRQKPQMDALIWRNSQSFPEACGPLTSQSFRTTKTFNGGPTLRTHALKHTELEAAAASPRAWHARPVG